MAVSDWSTSAASNTSVGGINIAPGMARSDVDNAIRAVMAEAKAKFLEDISITDMGGDPTGSSDSATAINAAITEAQSTGRAILVDGQFLYNSQITVPAKVRFRGHGTLVSDKSLRSKSCFIKNFNGIGFLFSGDETGTDGVQYDSAAAKTGDNVQVTGTRWNAPSICITNAGNDGLRIGATEAGTGTINANAWFIGRIQVYGSGRYGIRIDHTNTNTSANYPLGTPDCNAGTIISAELRDNASHNISFGNTIDNWVGHLVSQGSTGGYGCHFGDSARNNFIQKSYTESNSSGDGILDSGATQNVIWASRAVTLSTGWTNNSGNTSNLIFGHNDNVGEVAGNNTDPWYWPDAFNQLTSANSLAHRQYVGTNVLPGEWRTDTDGASGTKQTIATRTTGVGLEDKLVVREDGTVEIAKAKPLKINGTQVVSTRRTGWATATGTATRTTFDTTTVTTAQLAERVKALIDDLHGTAGHGLIGT